MAQALRHPNMRILALDTSTEYCSTALWTDAGLIERDVHAGQRHSELLLGMIDEVLRAAGVPLEALDGIAYGEGPGSFTGLRIACGVTQGLAFAAGLPVAGVSTLLALAQGTDADRVVCCMDARMNQVYHAAYRRATGGWAVVQPPALDSPSEVPLPAEDGWVGCGSGFAAYGPQLEARYGSRLARVLPERYPRARDIAQLAAAQFEAGKGLHADAAAPCYIRDKVALRTDERAS